MFVLSRLEAGVLSPPLGAALWSRTRLHYLAVEFISERLCVCMCVLGVCVYMYNTHTSMAGVNCKYVYMYRYLYMY